MHQSTIINIYYQKSPSSTYNWLSKTKHKRKKMKGKIRAKKKKKGLAGHLSYYNIKFQFCNYFPNLIFPFLLKKYFILIIICFLYQLLFYVEEGHLLISFIMLTIKVDLI